MVDTKAPIQVWFDSSCPLCAREIAWLRRLDRQGAIRFIDATDPGVACPIDRATLLERLHAQDGDRFMSGAAAFAAMWRAIPVLRPLGIVAGWRWATPLFDFAYRLFLRHRPRLQRLLR